MILWLIFFLGLVSKTQSVPDGDKQCKSDWKYYRPERHCVKYFGWKGTWYRARMNCQLRGGFMMTVKDKGKTDWVKANFKPTRPIHIGIFKQGRQGWKWTDRTTLLKSQENWADSSETSDRSGRPKCGWVEDVQGTFKWKRGSCSTRSIPYFCDAKLTCTRGNGGCGEHRCEMRDSVAKCVCNEGFVNNEYGDCVVNITCSINNGECGNHTTCQDVGRLKVKCSCMAGYNTTAEGDCVAVNPCDVDNGGCQDQQTCRMTSPGDRKCVNDDDDEVEFKNNLVFQVLLFWVFLLPYTVVAAVLIIWCKNRKKDGDEKGPESGEKVPEDQPMGENFDGEYYEDEDYYDENDDDYYDDENDDDYYDHYEEDYNEE